MYFTSTVLNDDQEWSSDFVQTLLTKLCSEWNEKMEFHWLSQEKKIGDYLDAPSFAPKNVLQISYTRYIKISIFSNSDPHESELQNRTDRQLFFVFLEWVSLRT